MISVMIWCSSLEERNVSAFLAMHSLLCSPSFLLPSHPLICALPLTCSLPDSWSLGLLPNLYLSLELYTISAIIPRLEKSTSFFTHDWPRPCSVCGSADDSSLCQDEIREHTRTLCYRCTYLAFPVKCNPIMWERLFKIFLHRCGRLGDLGF